MKKRYDFVKIAILLGTFIYITSVILMLGLMAKQYIELEKDIRDTTKATKQLYDDIYKTINGIKLLCPEDLIEKDGEPIEEKPKPESKDTEERLLRTANYEYDYVRATCYTDETGKGLGICYDGTPTYFGCLAGSKEQLGKEVILLDEELNYLGNFKFHDTGDPAYVNSKRIDIWQPSLTEANNWIKEVGDYVYIIYI